MLSRIAHNVNRVLRKQKAGIVSVLDAGCARRFLNTSENPLMGLHTNPLPKHNGSSRDSASAIVPKLLVKCWKSPMKCPLSGLCVKAFPRTWRPVLGALIVGNQLTQRMCSNRRQVASDVLIIAVV
jgi:hypothetical protein